MTPSAPGSPATTPGEVLDFWLGDGMAQGWPTQDLNKRWFQGGAALDQEISTRFGKDVVQAVSGALKDWENQTHSRLALVILLDQFSRNVFRATAQAFAGDARARQLTLQTLAAHEDQQLPWVARIFLYMPLMHAEDAALQEESVARFSQLLAEAPENLKPRIQGNLDFAREHQGIIARFGRFPYRNATLQRISTPEEAEFLVKGPRYGQ
jgi:uncharacterized protein (DUF924 family)